MSSIIIQDPKVSEQPILSSAAGESVADNNDNIDDKMIQVYLSRWWMLFVFAVSSITSGILWITFAPVAFLTQSYYNVDANQVNGLSIVFMAAYVPFSVVASWVFQRFGVRLGFILATVLTTFSGLIRYLSTTNQSYAVLMVGQSLAAIAQPFITNMPAKLGAIWFPKEERDLAVVLAFLSNILGVAIGSALPAAYTSTADDGSSTIAMDTLLLSEFILTLVLLLIVVVTFKEKPPTPPSHSESSRADSIAPDLTIKRQLYQLFSNKDFIILVISVGCLSLGLLNSLVTILEQFIVPVGYTSDDASLFTSLCIISGIIFSIIAGAVMDKTHAYNSLLKLGLGLGVAAFLFFFLVLRPGMRIPLALSSCLIGMTMLPLLPLAMECACECTYPISEDLSSGILMSAGQISGIVMLVALDGMLQQEPDFDASYTMRPSYLLFIVGSLVALIIGSFYKGKHLRMEADKKNHVSELRHDDDVLPDESTSLSENPMAYSA